MAKKAPVTMEFTVYARTFADVPAENRVAIEILATADQVRDLRDMLNALLARTATSQVSLADAQAIFPANRLVARLWGAMVRSGAFDTKCSICKPACKYCPHAPLLAFGKSDIIQHMEAFATAAMVGIVHNAGTATIELGRKLAQALADAPER